MNPSTLLSAQEWAEHTFGPVRLGDQRRTQRAVGGGAARPPPPPGSSARLQRSYVRLHW
jgi:hypothetical protein